ncbi:TPR repeat-containing protein DDB_G0287407-like [Haliotis rubra]|uniref:TPR repeat-containing protein DDB_G0287407-like n=1 Tax=Haliotis rubra TaxID=36100 RepID=UPI001EE5377B|nr:TPR repeat-containing protein DDB_G0287407-like [Haliotis rubra]
MSSLPTKLKDPRTCRIFFSSPFGGMEEEREELTRKYFPQIHHLCNSRGIQFVAVDMRWGITSEAAEDAQTVSICLRELDRSDMFVGFFGQRYGWFGKNDGALQKNIDNAIQRYPWLDGHRGKSVTEMEFLHGHLNSPGAMPAIICFRDKGYDDMKRAEGETRGDKKQVFKFSAENSESVQLMDDLKQRVEETRDKTLGVQMKYSTPAEAAEFMFAGVWEHLNNALLLDTSSSQSPREKAKAHHDAFAATRSSLYVGGDKYFKYLKENVINADDNPRVMVCGPAGSGKSALLSCWIPKLREEEKGLIVAYHFIGCAPDSDSPLEILKHLKDEVAFCLSGEESSSGTEKSGGKNVQEMMQLLQQTLEQASSQTRNVLIIIDGLDKVKLSAKAQKPLYWLPLISSKRVRVVVSIKDTETKSLEVLESAAL